MSNYECQHHEHYVSEKDQYICPIVLWESLSLDEKLALAVDAPLAVAAGIYYYKWHELPDSIRAKVTAMARAA